MTRYKPEYRITTQDEDGNISTTTTKGDPPKKGDSLEYLTEPRVAIAQVTKVELLDEDGAVVGQLTELGNTLHRLPEPEVIDDDGAQVDASTGDAQGNGPAHIPAGGAQ